MNDHDEIDELLYSFKLNGFNHSMQFIVFNKKQCINHSN